MQNKTSYTSPPKKRLAWKIFFSLSSLEGFFALFFIFAAPSEGKNALLWGYSAERLALGILVLFFLIFFVFLTIGAWKKTNAYIRVISWTDAYLDNYQNACVVFAWVFLGFITNLALMLLLISPLAVHLNNLRGYLLRSLPILLWSFAIFAQASILLWGQYTTPMQIRIRDIFRASLLPILFYFSFSHWLILSFQIFLFAMIDGWFWRFRIKETPNFWLFIPIAVLSLAVVLIILKSPERTKRNILILMILGYFLQFSFGFFTTGGIKTIRDQFFH